jgi:hypothetical protein
MKHPIKVEHVIEAERLITQAHEAADAKDYERVTALAALAQAHVSISRYAEGSEGLADMIEQLTQISQALVNQGPL